MSIKKISAFCLTFAAVGAASAAPAQATAGQLDLDAAMPPGCEAEVWWNTAANPMAGAEVGNPTYCVRRILAPIGTLAVDLPPLPDISAS